MTETWQAKYREHPMWLELDRAQTALGEVNLSASDIRIASLRSLLLELQERRDTPSILITESSLDEIYMPLQYLTRSLPDHIDNIFAEPNAAFDHLANSIRSWPAKSSSGLQGLHLQVKQLEDAMADARNLLAAQVEQFEESLNQDIEAELQKLEASNSEFLQLMEESHEARIDTFSGDFESIAAKVATLKKSSDTLNVDISDIRDRIAAQAKRLDESISERSTKFEEQTQQQTQQWEDLVTRVEADANGHLQRMKKLKTQAVDLLAAIGVTATAGSYGDYAQNQEKSANLWRIWAVLAFLAAGLVFTALTIAPYFGWAPGSNLHWWEFALQRVGTPLGIAGVAAFMARESGLHRKQQRIAKQAHLTLSALEPFIANMPIEQGDEIRSKTALKLFVDGPKYDIAADDREKGYDPASDPVGESH